jgi:6-pyruvoyltetrahydropterin/6-carboxytetrahydropterin synthase
MVTVNRVGHFNAAHRLHNPDLSPEENQKVFGLCNNEYFHGHNYEYIVSVKGDVDPVTGYVVDMKWLADLMKSHVEKVFDHKNLNLQVKPFDTINPTAENIVQEIWKILRKEIPSSQQLKVTLYETPRNYVEYEG